MMNVSHPFFNSFSHTKKVPPAYLALFSATLEKVESMHKLEEPPTFQRCSACHIPILVPTCNIGSCPILWRLARCHHSLHLDCLAPLGRPYVVSLYPPNALATSMTLLSFFFRIIPASYSTHNRLISSYKD